MKSDISSAELVEAFETSSVKAIHAGPIEITNVGPLFGTTGDILAIRGDKERGVGNAKGFLYGNLIERVRQQMIEHPNHALFDGVGVSSFPAMIDAARREKRPSLVVVAREFPKHLIPRSAKRRPDVLMVRARGQAEKGYVDQMSHELASRENIIPLNQAYYGALAMAPVGNWVVQWCEEHHIRPEATVWCIASGTSLYGIGRIIAQRFTGVETSVVTKRLAMSDHRLRDVRQMTTLAREALRWYRTDTPELPIEQIDAATFPLHLRGPSIATLRYWALKGAVGIDHLVQSNLADVLEVDARLRSAEYAWSITTSMCLVEAIRLAKAGKTVITIVYGPRLRY